MVYMSAYLITLDEHHDKKAANLRQQIRRAEDAETMVKRLQVQLAEARAQATTAESCEAATVEALKQAEDHHSQELKRAHLTAWARRRIVNIDDDEAPILDEIPIAQGSCKRKCLEAPPAPPLTEVSQEAPEPDVAIEEEGKEEEILPLT